MSVQPDLNTLLGLQVSPEAPGFLVYSDRSSARLNYVCGFIFGQVLKVHFSITSDIAEWKNSPLYRINYSSTIQQNSFQIRPRELLFETGVTEVRPAAFFKDRQLYFFETEKADDSCLHFDIFSAVFYFISRYEEWQDYERDAHGRFEAGAGILYMHGKHLKPVVDQWIQELRSRLCGAFAGLVFPKTEFRMISTIDVDNLFAYRSKGLWRTLGAGAKDLLRFDLRNFGARMKVVLRLQSDPFDVYDQICQFCSERKIPLIFFFLFRTGTRYDRTVNPASGAFEPVFSTLKKYGVAAGLHPSYDSALREDILKREVNDFSSRWKEKVTITRQHFLRFDIRITPQLLIKQGIKADFSMGFASSEGFRAGTSNPFYYYDLGADRQTDLLFVPFCGMDGVYFVYDQVQPEKALNSLLQLAEEVKKVNGIFTTVFHERTFSDHLYRGFGGLYKNLYLRLKGA